jgi:amphi-Trp domain-containing protein
MGRESDQSRNPGRAVDDEDPGVSPMEGVAMTTGAAKPYDVESVEEDRSRSMGWRERKPDRDIEKDYPLAEFIDKLRRLADALEEGQRFEIQIAGERISVPVRATYNIEHERDESGEEIEFQIKWSASEP